MGDPALTPNTDDLRDRVIAVMQDEELPYSEVGEAMGATKQAAHQFINGGRVDYETGKRLEVWLDGKGR